MAEIKFTPGPWRACRNGDCSCRQVWSIQADVPVFTARAEKMSHVGLAHHKWGDGPDMIYGEIPLAETHANARLIAAAPELYEALSAMADGTTAEWTRKLTAARAALAKARGEQEATHA